MNVTPQLLLSRNSKDFSPTQRSSSWLTTTSLWVINRDHLGVNQGRLALPFQIRISLRVHLDLHKSFQRRWWFVMSHMSYKEDKIIKTALARYFSQRVVPHVSILLDVKTGQHPHKSVISLCGCVLPFCTRCSSAAYYVWGDMSLFVKWWVSGNMQEGGDCSSKWADIRILGDFWPMIYLFK